VRKHIYVAGPMTGIKCFNYPAFDVAVEKLRDDGFKVTSPHELDDPDTRAAALASPDGSPGSGSANGETWGDFLARDLKLIADSDIEEIRVLPGWFRSKGARLETFVAQLCGKPVCYLDGKPVPKGQLLLAWGYSVHADHEDSETMTELLEALEVTL
jgi:Domain of unknown function (DUF4406)